MLGDGKWLRFRSESFGRLAGQGKVDVELADSCGGEGGEASYVYRVKVTIMTRSVVEKKVGSVPGRGRWWQGGGVFRSGDITFSVGEAFEPCETHLGGLYRGRRPTNHHVVTLHRHEVRSTKYD